MGRLADLWREGSIRPSSGGVDIPFGKYRVLREVGCGGFGIVYLAIDSETESEVAIKIPHITSLQNEERLHRFQLEAEMISRLDHPGIVRIHEANVTSPTPYIATEYCNGLDLAQWLAEQQSPVSWQEAAEFVAKLAEAIHYTHSNGIFHRDLKPSNVLLAARSSNVSGNGTPFVERPLSQFHAKITDFGLGKLVDDAMTDTRTSLIIGTPLYMAPEQLSSIPSENELLAATDVYSLGVILFELLTLQHPFDGRNHFETVGRILNQPPKRLRQLNSSVPKSLLRICEVCLEKNPTRRYVSAVELSIELRNCAEGKATSKRHISLTHRIRDYGTQERRIAEAGWFTVWAQTALTAWAISFWGVVGLMRIFGYDAVPNATFANVMFWIIVLFPGLAWPLIWLGWKLTQREHWAAWIALPLTLSALPACILGCTGNAIAFSELYADRPTFSALTHTLILMLHLVQAMLLWVALIAIRHDKRLL